MIVAYLPSLPVATAASDVTAVFRPRSDLTMTTFWHVSMWNCSLPFSTSQNRMDPSMLPVTTQSCSVGCQATDVTAAVCPTVFVGSDTYMSPRMNFSSSLPSLSTKRGCRLPVVTSSLSPFLEYAMSTMRWFPSSSMRTVVNGRGLASESPAKSNSRTQPSDAPMAKRAPVGSMAVQVTTIEDTAECDASTMLEHSMWKASWRGSRCLSIRDDSLADS
mmetsp:Transcript_17208/g.48409  ORF Transcript_17208/g.48409 Transcript_17208/m.48409 type:complete len:218 (-) Transcript_17208:929-1582(-)